MYEIDSDEGIWNSARNGTANLAHRPRPRRATSRSRRWTSCRTCAAEMVLALQASGIDVEVQHHEVGGPVRPRSTSATGRSSRPPTRSLSYKYLVKQVARSARQGRDVHAEAALRRQRLGHAYPPEPLEGRHEPLLRREGLRAVVGHGALVHRRPAQAREGGPRLRGPDDELVSPARAGLRGADQPRVLAAQPLGVHPHPDVLHDPGRATPRVPLARPDLQPVPVVQRPAASPVSTASSTRSSRRPRSIATSTR